MPLHTLTTGTKFKDSDFNKIERPNRLKIDGLFSNKFGKLKVLSIIGVRNKRVYAKCICDCGNIAYVPIVSLRYGKTTSCGCNILEAQNNYYKNRWKSSKHTHTPLYRTWQGMKTRCYNPNNLLDKMYYKDRGITICDEWLGKDGFTNFYNWAIANGYSDEKRENGYRRLTIDRIDNNKGYSPQNCRWVDMKVQIDNRRKPRPKGSVNCKLLSKIRVNNSLEEKFF